jgi:hypothetical protein
MTAVTLLCLFQGFEQAGQLHMTSLTSSLAHGQPSLASSAQGGKVTFKMSRDDGNEQYFDILIDGLCD